MKGQNKLPHTVWECKYHVVFVLKYRRKVLYKELRKYLGKLFHELVRQKESWNRRGVLDGRPCSHVD